MIKEIWKLDITPQEAAELLDKKMEAERIAAYELAGEVTAAETAEGESLPVPCCIVRVYERWYGLSGTTATMTITLDNLAGETRVNFTAGAGSRMPRGRMDWGVRNDFENMAKRVLMSNRVKDEEGR